MAMIGLDMAIPIGPTVLRSEAAFFPKRNFQKDAQTIVKENMTGTAETTKELNQLNALVGLDWMPSGWTLTAQYFCDYVFGNLDNIDRKDAYTYGAYKDYSSIYINVKFSI